MARLSRALRRWEPVRIAAVSLGLATALLLGAYGVAAATATATPGALAAAAALVGIAGSGLLYAWRLGAGGGVD